MNAPVHREPDHSAPLAPLHVVCAATMIVVDWLMYGANWLLGARSVLLTTLVGSAVCALCVGWVERVRDPGTRTLATQKALVAAAAVAIPLPIVGTVLGTVALIWAMLVSAPRPRRARRH